MRVWLAVAALGSLGACGDETAAPAVRFDAGRLLEDAGFAEPMDLGTGDAADFADVMTSDSGLARDARLEPGTGIDTFVPVTEGATLRWEAGPQGGYHVFGGARVALESLDGLSEGARSEVIHEYILETEEGAIVARTVRSGRFTRAEEGYLSRGILLVLEPGLSPYRVAESPLVYSVRVELPSETLASSLRVQTACCD